MLSELQRKDSDFQAAMKKYDKYKQVTRELEEELVKKDQKVKALEMEIKNNELANDFENDIPDNLGLELGDELGADGDAQ